MIDHDDARLVRALAVEGTARKAAARLSLHVATLYRQFHALEARLGLALFDKIDGIYLPTPLASEIVAAADAMQATLDELGRRAAGHDGRLSGRLAVTTTDTMLPLVTEAIAPFVVRHDVLTVELAIGNPFADMRRHEADVAIRPTIAPPDTLIGRRVGAIAFAVFACPDAPDTWIGFDESLAAIPAARWLEATVEQPPRLRVNSLWAAAQAAAAGVGRAVLPTYLAHGMPLARQGGEVKALASELWVLYHPDLRSTPRVRHFVREVTPRLARLLAERSAARFSRVGF